MHQKGPREGNFPSMNKLILPLENSASVCFPRFSWRSSKAQAASCHRSVTPQGEGWHKAHCEHKCAFCLLKGRELGSHPVGMPGLVKTRHIQHREGGEEVSWVKANDAWWEKGDLVTGQGQKA